MYRPILHTTARSSLRSIIPASRRGISYTVASMAEGDTGGVRSGGAASGDAFTKREQSNEALYVREKEMEKLRALKAKIAAHKKELEELDKNVEEQLNEGNPKVE